MTGLTMSSVDGWFRITEWLTAPILARCLRSSLLDLVVGVNGVVLCCTLVVLVLLVLFSL